MQRGTMKNTVTAAAFALLMPTLSACYYYDDYDRHWGRDRDYRSRRDNDWRDRDRYGRYRDRDDYWDRHGRYRYRDRDDYWDRYGRYRYRDRDWDDRYSSRRRDRDDD